jgi:hypothetical protein
MRQACKAVIAIFAVLYVMALALLAVGTFGLFGSERDPLAGVFVLLLGMPWNRGLSGGLFKAALPWVAIATPPVNLALLCRFLPRRAA